VYGDLYGVNHHEYGVLWHKAIAHQSTHRRWNSRHTSRNRDIQQADDGSAC
jgi:hypothetical protein